MALLIIRSSYYLVFFFLLYAVAFSELGLTPLNIGLIVGVSFFFFISFIITGLNMDIKGLLRVLYSKPVRKADGTVEYSSKEKY